MLNNVMLGVKSKFAAVMLLGMFCTSLVAAAGAAELTETTTAFGHVNGASSRDDAVSQATQGAQDAANHHCSVVHSGTITDMETTDAAAQPLNWNGPGQWSASVHVSYTCQWER